VKVFLSHNRADKPTARRLGADLVLAGADVWFDEWEIRAGDSIPGKLNEGLTEFDVFLLLWSENAARSDWVRGELESAIARAMHDHSTRIIPMVLDDTPVPALVAPLRHLKVEDGIDAATDAILGFEGERQRRMAMQLAIEEGSLEIVTFHGYGPAVGCPACGADVGSIGGWSSTDDERGDTYAGAECHECGWNDGGEV